jgi:hypothetical protein
MAGGKVVQIPGVGNVEFPADMSDADVAKEAQKAYDAAPSEPDTMMGGMAKGFKEGVVGGASGFAKGLLPGVWSGSKGIVMLPISLIKGAIDTVGGAERLAKDPEGTLNDVLTTWKNAPKEAIDAVKSTLDLARNDPEAFGKAVGQITGETEVGIAAAKAVPMLPKPLATKVGSTMSRFGKQAGWPLRITGAHQIISGNVLGGVGTMMAPQMLESTGEALQNFGGRTSVTPRLVGSDTPPSRNVTTGGMRMAPGKEQGVTSTVTKSLEEAINKAPGMHSYTDEAITAAKKQSDAARTASAKAESVATKAETKADLDNLRNKRFTDQTGGSNTPKSDAELAQEYLSKQRQPAWAPAPTSLRGAGLPGGVRLAQPVGSSTPFKAAEEISTPGSVKYQETQAAKNRPIAKVSTGSAAVPGGDPYAKLGTRFIPGIDKVDAPGNPAAGLGPVDMPRGGSVETGPAPVTPERNAEVSAGPVGGIRDTPNRTPIPTSAPSASYTEETGYVPRNPLTLTSSEGGLSESDVNPITAEMMYREISRKSIITPDDAITLKSLKDLIQRRASEVGTSYASGGKAGPAISPKDEY